MSKMFNLKNGRSIEASLYLHDRTKRATIHFQVMTIEDKGGYFTKTFTIFEDPSKHYQIGTFTRKTAKQLGLLNDKFTQELPACLEMFCKEYSLEVLDA